MEFTWHGHGTFAIESADGTTVVIDPWTEGHPGADPNPANDLTPVDLDPDIVAITHSDVADHAGEAHLYTGDATVLTQPKMHRHLTRRGYENLAPMDIGGEFAFADLTFLMIHAFHSLGTTHPDLEPVEYGGHAAGYVIDDGETRFYISGDTGLFGDMKTVVGDVYDPDVAALPIGGRVTMEARHAAVAADWLDVDVVIPYHYNTAPFLEADPEAFADAVDARCDTDVHVLDVGESVAYTP